MVHFLVLRVDKRLESKVLDHVEASIEQGKEQDSLKKLVVSVSLIFFCAHKLINVVLIKSIGLLES